MAHPAETRDKLRGLYINGTSLEVAAAICGVAYGTARKWRDTAKDKGDDWDKLRAAYTLSGGSIEDLARAIMTGFLVQPARPAQPQAGRLHLVARRCAIRADRPHPFEPDWQQPVE